MILSISVCLLDTCSIPSAQTLLESNKPLPQTMKLVNHPLIFPGHVPRDFPLELSLVYVTGSEVKDQVSVKSPKPWVLPPPRNSLH